MAAHKRLWTGVLGIGLGLAACDSDKSEDTMPGPDTQSDTQVGADQDDGQNGADSGHTDTDIPVEVGPLRSIRMPASGLVSPDTDFEVSGKVMAYQVVSIRSEGQPSRVFHAQADASGDFVLTMQLPAGKHDLSVAVSTGQARPDAYVLGTYIPLVSQYLVTPHRYSTPSFNAARLVDWDLYQSRGEVLLSLGKVSRVSADASSPWASQPIEDLRFVSAFDDTCASTNSSEILFNTPSGGVLSKAWIAATQPNLYGYFVDAEGVRSECTFISKAYGELSVAVRALSSEGAKPNLTGRAWVLTPHNTSEEVGIANGRINTQAPLGVGVAVEEYAYSTLNDPFSIGENITLSVFWDLPLEQPNLRTEQAYLDEVIFTQTPEHSPVNAWVWGPCGVANRLMLTGDLSGTGAGIWGFWVSLNTQCEAGGQESTFHHFNAQSPDLLGQTRGHVGSEVGLLAGSVGVDLENLVLTENKVPTQWESDFGDVAVEVRGLEVGVHPIRVSAWPESPWYTGSVHAFLSEDSNGSLKATLHQMGTLLDGQGMVALSEESETQVRLFARTQRENQLSFDLGADKPERLPHFVSPFNVVEQPNPSSGRVDMTQMGLEGIELLKDARFGLDYPVRGHVVLSGRPQAPNIVSTRHFEQFWMLDFGSWPKVSWPGTEKVTLNVPWDEKKVEVNFLGFMEPTSWNWVLGARHLNAHAQTFATSYQGQAREALQVIKGSWTF